MFSFRELNSLRGLTAMARQDTATITEPNGGTTRGAGGGVIQSTTSTTAACRLETTQSLTGDVRETVGRLQLKNPMVVYFAHDQAVSNQAVITINGRTFIAKALLFEGTYAMEKAVLVDEVKQ